MNPPVELTRITGIGPGRRDFFIKAKIRLGTDPTCEVRFNATWDKTVSPQHCTLQWRNDGLWLEDTSREGCWINGQCISRERLEDGSILELGKGGPKVRIEFDPIPLKSHDSLRPPGSIPLYPKLRF
jgi:predicted component of type VI protein secretion system